MTRYLKVTSVCYCCGAYSCDAHRICLSCFQRIYRPKVSIQRRPRRVSFIEWKNTPKHWIEEWAKNFKGKKILEWKAVSVPMALYVSKIFPIRRPLFIIDPSNSKDHSYWLAHFLAEELSAQHLPYFFRLETCNQNLPVQKERSRAARYQRRYSVHPQYKNFIANQRGTCDFLFVDDIVTTGATIEAAQKAMGGGEIALAITFFHRPFHER